MSDGSKARQKYREQLAIDEADLDRCLIEQPELYFHVADNHARAVAVRDAAKLDLEEAEADLDEQLRRQAEKAEERVTEAQLRQRVAASPKIKQLKREHLAARSEVSSWSALQDAFSMRSDLLRKLVDSNIHRRRADNISSGSAGARGDLAAQNRAEAGALRRERMVR